MNLICHRHSFPNEFTHPQMDANLKNEIHEISRFLANLSLHMLIASEFWKSFNALAPVNTLWRILNKANLIVSAKQNANGGYFARVRLHLRYVVVNQTRVKLTAFCSSQWFNDTKIFLSSSIFFFFFLISKIRYLNFPVIEFPTCTRHICSFRSSFPPFMIILSSLLAFLRKYLYYLYYQKKKQFLS